MERVVEIKLLVYCNTDSNVCTSKISTSNRNLNLKNNCEENSIKTDKTVNIEEINCSGCIKGVIEREKIYKNCDTCKIKKFVV